MAVKSTVNAMEERLPVSMLRMKFGDTQQMKMGFIPGKPSVSAECGGRDAASYHAASNGCRHL